MSSDAIYRPLGQSGLRVPSLWLGTMMFGGPTDEAEAREIVAAAQDAGLNAIDTADNYCGGESERAVGRLIASNRSRWVVATKVANPVGNEPNDRGLSRRWLMQAVDHSLGRLRSEWIDLYYMHRDDEVTPVEEIVGTMARLIELGKIRYYGVSNFRAWRVAQLVETARRMGVPQPIACQPPYSAVNRQIETELLPACQHYGVGVIAYSPLARGVLSGKYRPNEAPDPASRAGRGDKRLLQTEFQPRALTLSQEFKEFASQRGLSPVSFAMAWVLNNRHVNGVIGGPRTLAQWKEYIAALSVRLTPSDEAFVERCVPAGYAATYGYTDPQYPLDGRAPRNHEDTK
ncbi:L-glyceraldehyde 3-phosphate reductase [Variovorax sp. SRS16]|uniref:aldo/keto reductase n=1 Tax=Variovorax sp. SRS16 TaxID=282217 RepID=UPI0013163440|nr:aldo/keto reductase [Variovorax sp. SRS16]VTU13202.1 L-glyceraldehyde 3-phosphate reductase [Variovorax sp. SRS16]